MSESVITTVLDSREPFYIPSIQREVVWTKEKWINTTKDIINLKTLPNGNTEIMNLQAIEIKRNEKVLGMTKPVSVLYDGLQRLAYLSSILSIIYHKSKLPFADITHTDIVWSPDLLKMEKVYNFIKSGVWLNNLNGYLDKDAMETKFYNNFVSTLTYYNNLTDEEKEKLHTNIHYNVRWFVEVLDPDMDETKSFVTVNSKGTQALDFEIIKAFYRDKNGQHTRYKLIENKFDVSKDNGRSFNDFLSNAGHIFYERLPNDNVARNKYYSEKWRTLDLFNNTEHEIVSIDELDIMSDIWVSTFNNSPYYSVLKSRCLSDKLMTIMFKFAYSNNKEKDNIIDLLYKFVTIVAMLFTSKDKDNWNNDSMIGSNYGTDNFIKPLTKLCNRDTVDKTTTSMIKKVIVDYVVLLEKKAKVPNYFNYRLNQVFLNEDILETSKDMALAKLVLYYIDVYKDPTYKGRRSFDSSLVDGDHARSKQSAITDLSFATVVNKIGNLALLCKSANRSKGDGNILIEARSNDYRNSGFVTTTELSDYVIEHNSWGKDDIMYFTEKRKNEFIEFSNTIIK